LPINKKSSPTAESNAVGEAEMLSIIDFCCRDSKKSSPTARGGSLGGVIENDFLMCEIEKSRFHSFSKSPSEKWRRRESNAVGEAEIPLKINIFYFGNPTIQ
jgi:hypothetical protein